MSEKNEIVSTTAIGAGSVSAFENASSFELAQRMAKMLSQSKLVPAQFQNNMPDCIIGIELANRLKAPVLSVMQSMYIVHGKPAWSSQFLIAQVNASGRFSMPLQFKYSGEKESRSCRAWSKDNDGNIIEGTEVSVDMAKKEGWFSKSGSKWQTMPELMLAYRAATFFARLYIPELTMGLMTQEEIVDIQDGAGNSVAQQTKKQSIIVETED